ncbi:MAG: hypothetical protein IID41_05295 [Planctomycetes bacterium]|nr:hypothetical protein [Planctomycetota bacterium]
MPEPSRIMFILAPAICALAAASIAQHPEEAGLSVVPSSVDTEFSGLTQSVADDPKAVRFVSGGNSACGPDAGPCSEANGSPGCEDTECCNAVCDLDPFCCDVEWDEYCAGPNIFVPGASCSELCVGPGQPCEGLPPGTVDIAVSRIGESTGGSNDYQEYGVVGGIAAFAGATTSCNVGSEEAEWIHNGNDEGSETRHPLISQHLYRLSADGKRFEMIGMSWLKHAFCAVNESTCGACQQTNCASLGIGCADTYTALRNGGSNLGPRGQTNPLGQWSEPGDSGTHSHPHPSPSGAETLAGRLQVHTSDLDVSGADYFFEAQYITHDEPITRRRNNASWLKVAMPAGPEFTGNIVSLEGVRTEEIALRAWQEDDAEVVIVPLEDEQGGRFHLAYRVSDNGDGTWHYEYALHNMNSQLAATGFEVPVPDNVVVSGMGFHDVDYHSGDGDPATGGGGDYDGTDWTVTDGAGTLSWDMQVVGHYDNSNALRWGTTYNFRFDANTPPESAVAVIKHYRPTQGPDSFTATTLGPSPDVSDCPNACSGHGICESGSCICDAGWDGSDCSIPICEMPCQNGGTCAAPNTCECAAGWEGGDCSIPICTDPCQNGTCTAPDTCLCFRGWGGPVCEDAVCEPPCVNGDCSAPNSCSCQPGWEGVDCSVPICSDPCEHGTCTAPNTCSCDAGWGGPTCSDVVCEPSCVHGSCIAPNECECDPGWEGPSCAEPICVPACVNGTCSAPNTCDCAAGWTGDDCATPVCEPECVNGTCTAPDTCDCDSGWSGPACTERMCVPSCAHGTCTAPDVCTCDAGWGGPACDVPICEPACANGTCTAPNTCSCDSGWAGPTCADPVCEPACVNGTCAEPDTCVCEPGWAGPTCADFVCVPDCQNGTCTAPNTCDCDSGWTGDDCSIPICTPSCVNGECVLPDLCECDLGWEGPNCNSPICELDCVNGTCVAPNTCTCEAGWDGATCTDPICEPICDHGQCVLPDLCECETGWEGPTCSDAMCAPACVHGTCVAPEVCECDSGWGGPDCSMPTCPADFNGDGTVGPFDLANLLGAWGPCTDCPEDLDGNGTVGPFDLAVLLGTWGPCS